MATKSSLKRAQFWRADWVAGVLIVLAVVLLNQATDLIGTLERRFYDFSSTSTSRQPSDRIAIIAIDDQSIANIGRWPWSRDIHAKLIDMLAAAKAEVRRIILDRLAGNEQWVLVGGPPCQAYSLAGRSRMKGDPDFAKDEKNTLYLKYLRIIADHRPPIFIT